MRPACDIGTGAMSVGGGCGTRRCHDVGTIADDISDDNPDDSCTSNYAHDSAKTALSCLVTRSARSWQCGGQGLESP
jgi:hypothetical protein